MMLTPEEEEKLRALTHVFEFQKERGMTMMYPMHLEQVQWLAEKLKEVNEELKARDIWCIHNCK